MSRTELVLNFTSDELSFRTLAAIFLEVKRKVSELIKSIDQQE